MDYDEDENVVHLIPKEVTYRFNSNFSGRDIAGAFQEGLDNACILYPWSMDEPEKPGLKCVPVTSNASAERLRDISVGIAEQEKSEQVTPNDYAMFWGGLDEMGQCEVEL